MGLSALLLNAEVADPAEDAGEAMDLRKRRRVGLERWWMAGRGERMSALERLPAGVAWRRGRSGRRRGGAQELIARGAGREAVT
jgi:hypothetical protein